MIDTIKIHVQAGTGGRGAISFYREKFRPKGGPDGGAGGRGGSVILKADTGLNTLEWFQGQKSFKAENGGPGKRNKRTGKSGEDLVLAVPVGTQVRRCVERGIRELLVDLVIPGQEVVVAQGGVGGLGNASFTTSENQTPLLAECGEEGEMIILYLELRLLADVALVGLPNVGKSTLLNRLAGTQAKVAAYPFTTVEPLLGIVSWRDQTFSILEVPGLLEGAHRGVGLGHEFLHHVQRTRVLLFVLDGTSKNPLSDYNLLLRELELFDPELVGREQVVAVNKIDLPEVSARLSELQQQLQLLESRLLFLSAVTGEGVEALLTLLAEAAARLDQKKALRVDEPPVTKGYPKGQRERAFVTKEGEGFVVHHRRARRIAAGTDLTRWEAQAQFRRLMARLGVSQAVERAGARAGSRVRFGKIELEW
jgi:GTP-binding protein